MKGLRIAVAGMGRSGIAIAQAALANGAVPVVYDEMAAEDPARIAAVEDLESKGIAVVTGWHGHLEAGSHDILVASPGFRRNHPAILDALANGIEVISEVEFAYRISKAPIVAITGTNGKSTTTVMAWMALRGLGIDAVLCGNISGSGYPELTLTEAALASSPDQVLVAEISSFQLEWVSQFRPRVAVVTRVTPDHFDRHPDFKDYLDTKLRIFAGQQADDYALVPDPMVMSRGDHNSSPREGEVATRPAATEGVSPFGATDPPPVRELTDLSPQARRGDQGEYPLDYLTSKTKAKIVRFHQDDTLSFPEPHNRMNAACAIAMAECIAADRGIENAREKAIQGLAEFQPLQFRMQTLGEKGGVLIINNSMCTNPDAVITSSQGLPRKQFLIMGGITKNLDFRPVGTYVKGTDHQIVLFGPDPTPMRQMLGFEAPYRETLEEAFAFAIEQAKDGDAVLLAPGCASAYPYANFRERGLAFEQIAKEWLNS